VNGFETAFGWVTGHEKLLSGLAALAVLAGFVVSPLGQGLRALLGRQRKKRGGVEPGGPTGPPPPMVTDRPSIAVLPFTNMSDDRDQEFLADGMTEDIITGLSLSRSLFVIARNSTFSYKGKAANIRDVGRELGVRNVLEGSVRRIGESLRVTAQLIDAKTGAHVWAQALDRPLADIFKMQDEITAGIVAALTAHLTHAVTAEVARARPESLEAWELCLRANAHFAAGFDAASRQSGEALLRTAVKKDPAYALAWVSLGCMIACRWIVEPGIEATLGQAEARACVERGARLAPVDPDVLARQGIFLIYCGQPKDAVPYLEQAMQLNPNEVTYRMRLAQALSMTDRAAQALGEMEAVLRLSPRDPLAPNFAYHLAQIQFALGRFAEAETWAKRSIAGRPRNVQARFRLAAALAAQDRVEEARQAVREAVRVAPETTLASQENFYRHMGSEESLLADELKFLAIAWPPELTVNPRAS